MKSKQWSGWERPAIKWRSRVASSARAIELSPGRRSRSSACRRRSSGEWRAGASGQCLTKTDGIYYFLDLPDGRYTVKGRDERAGAEMEKTVSVSRSKDGTVKMAVADLKLVEGGTK